MLGSIKVGMRIKAVLFELIQSKTLILKHFNNHIFKHGTNMKKINTKFIGHANHYMTIRLWRTGKVKWAKGKKPCAFAGHHAFFKL